jgi:hypothetical protein
MANKLRLGFVGGCLAHQPGIPYARLFHRVLSRKLEDRFGVRLEAVVCDRYGDEPHARLEALLREGPLDAVLVHRSTNTFFTKTALVFVVPDRDHVRYVLHPMFPRRRRRSWLELERTGFRECLTLRKISTPPSHADLPPPVEIPADRLASLMHTGETRPFRANDLSWIAADRCGLVAWAIQDEVRIVTQTHAVAASAGLPLIVLGPGLKIGHRWVIRFAARLDTALARAVSPLEGASYVSLLGRYATASPTPPLGVEHYMDQIHFNAAGHALVGDLIEPLLAHVIEAMPATSRLPSPR